MAPDRIPPTPPQDDEHSVPQVRLPEIGDKLLGQSSIGIVEMTVVEPEETDPPLVDGWVIVSYVDLEGGSRRKPVSLEAFNPDVQERMHELQAVEREMGEVGISEANATTPSPDVEHIVEAAPNPWSKEGGVMKEQNRLRDMFSAESLEDRGTGRELLRQLSEGAIAPEEFDGYACVEAIDIENARMARVLEGDDGELTGGWFLLADAIYLGEDSEDPHRGKYTMRGLFGKHSATGGSYRLADLDEVARLSAEHKELNRVVIDAPVPRTVVEVESADPEPYDPDAIENMRYYPPKKPEGQPAESPQEEGPVDGIQQEINEIGEKISDAENRRKAAFESQLKAEKDYGPESHEFSIAHESVEAVEIEIGNLDRQKRRLLDSRRGKPNVWQN